VDRPAFALTLTRGSTFVAVFLQVELRTSNLTSTAPSQPSSQRPAKNTRAKTLSRAVSNCSLAPFEGTGRIEITQCVATNLDYDHACA
jgi:hypothetical protein